MKKKILFLVLMLFIICSFNLLAKKSDENFKLPNTTYKLLENFSQNKEKTIEKLKTLRKDEAVELYWRYYDENVEFLQEMRENLAKLLKDTSKGEYKKVEKILDKYDLKFSTYSIPDSTDIGVDLELPQHFYYNIFKNYGTDAHRKYLKITDGEEPSGKYNYETDEFRLLITPQELGDRIIECENFLKEYSNINAEYDSYIKSCYNKYVAEYILEINGIMLEGDGDGYADNGTPKISKKILQEYDRFIKKYPNSKVTEFLKYFVKNYKNSNKRSIAWKKLGKLIN